MALTVGELLAKIKIDDKSFIRGIKNIRTQLRSVAPLLARGAGFAMLGVAIAGAASQAIALVNALAPVAGAVLMLPALLAAVAAPIAVVTIGMQGMGDAMKALASGDAAKINEALKNLAPNAQQAALAIHSLAPAWKAARLDIQQQLFAGIGAEVKKLGSAYIPLLRTQLSGLATVMNQQAKVASAALINPGQLRATVGILGNVRTAWAQLTPAIQPAIFAMTDVTYAGSVSLPRVSRAVSDLTTRFGAFITAAAESGKLQVWIGHALDAITQLGRIVGNVAGALRGLFTANTVGSGGLLTNLEMATAKVKDLVTSAQGQSTLTAFFRDTSSFLKDLLPIVAHLAGGLAVTLLPVVYEVARAFLPAAQAIADALLPAVAQLAPYLPQLATSFAQIIIALTPLIPVFVSIVSGLAAMATAVSGFVSQYKIAIPIVIGLLTAFGTAWLMARAKALLAAAGIRIAWLSAAGPIALIAAVVAGVVALIVMKWQTIKDWAQKIAKAVAGAFQAMGRWFMMVWTDYIKPVVDAIVTAMLWLWHNAIEPAAQAIGAVLLVMGQIWFTVGKIIFYIIETIVALVLYLAYQIFRPAFEAIWFLIQKVGEAAMWLWNNAIQPAVSGIAAAATWLWQTILVPVGDGIMATLAAVGGVFSWLWETIISPTLNAVASAIGWVWGVIQPILNRISAAVSSVGTTFATVFEGIAGIVVGAFDQAVAAVKAGINFIIRIINGAIHFINTKLIDTANEVPFVDIPHIPDIPQLAKGAYIPPTPGGRLARVAEAGQAEWALPDNKLKALVRDVAMAAGGGGDTHVYIGNDQLKPYLVKTIRNHPGEVAKATRAGEKQLARR